MKDIHPGDLVANDQWWTFREKKMLINLALWIVADPEELGAESTRIHRVVDFKPNQVGMVLSRHKAYVLVMISQAESQGSWGWCAESQLRRL